MAVTITDNRTNPTNNGADSTTGWVGSGALSLKTSEPSPVELTGSLGIIVSTATEDLYLSITSEDMSAGTLIYSWQLAQGIMDLEANGGQAVMIGDGTDYIGYHVGGSDKAGFRHNNASVAWQCMVVDTSSLPTGFTTRAGSEATLTLSTVTRIGAMYKTLAKSVGGAENCFTDIIRYGNGGLTITGGGTGTEGKFSEIAIEDALDTDGKAYGICHEVASGVFGLQGMLTFGDNVSTGSVDFFDNDVSVVFEDRGLNTDKYKILVVGNTTGATAFQLGIKSGTTGGSNGCALICPLGVGAAFDASDSNVESVLLYGGQFTNYDQLFNFSADATNGPNHEVFSYTFSGCAQIDPGKVQFKNNSIVGTVDANGGVLLDADGSGAWADLNFISDGTGHAIYITAPGTYSFDNFTYSGYGATASSDATVYNNSGGAVIINVNGGDTPSYLNGTSATTTVNNTNTLTVVVTSEATGTLLPDARVYIEAGATGPLTPGDVILAPELTGADGTVIATINGSGQDYTGMVTEALTPGLYVAKPISGTIPSGGATINVALVLDE